MLPFRSNAEVTAARAHGHPIVALESTILSHGMPYPDNLRTAQSVEQTVRDAGAVPATIAVIDGTLTVGLEGGELDRIARDPGMLKLSRADLAYAICTGRTGSTTVAATMICAHHAGIDVFATGGIGGVHRGAELSFDISADLQELARTPVAVVCAGVKAILDIPKTLEVLETLGVPVIAYGSDEFPAFWSRESGVRAPLRVDTPDAVAEIARTARALGLSHGLLIAQPPAPQSALARDEIDEAIARAIADSRAAGIEGKAVTPWLLERIRVLTQGRSLRCNAAFVEANAHLAAQIARALRA